MKRLVWLFLAVFCTALAQVQPVDLPLPKANSECCCCEGDGACGMPECALPPAAAQTQTPALARAGIVLRQVARRDAARLPQITPKFYSFVTERIVAATMLPAPASVAPAASPPLFRVHCSFLI
ncbi:MAG: hypothetical protein HYV95_17170 [Opitutae bacterium]|nr:hypothetical protein [Opitutae bacterium]